MEEPQKDKKNEKNENKEGIERNKENTKLLFYIPSMTVFIQETTTLHNLTSY